jgi:hypothetical protein
MFAVTLPAAANMVQNGSFEVTTATATATVTVTSTWPASAFGGRLGSPVSVANRSTSNIGQAIVLPSWQPGAPGTGVLFPTGLCNPGPPVGVAGPLPTTSPDGGNFVMSDGNYGNAPITQTITGPTPGQRVTLTFLQALVHDTQPNGTTPDAVTGYWQVTPGSTTLNSTLMTADGSTLTISGRAMQSMRFIPNAATEVPGFLSVGTGDPPLVLLDGVVLEAVPEPGTAAMMLLARAGGLLLYRRTRWRHVAA